MHRFNRSELRQSALAYMRELVAPLERRDGRPLAEEANVGPDRMHRLLNQIEWGRRVFLDMREHVVEHLGHRDAVPIVENTGFPKMGIRSVGVQRQ